MWYLRKYIFYLVTNVAISTSTIAQGIIAWFSNMENILKSLDRVNENILIEDELVMAIAEGNQNKTNFIYIFIRAT